MVSLNRHPFGGLHHGHIGMFSQQFAHQAFVRRVQMLNQYIRYADIHRQ